MNDLAVAYRVFQHIAVLDVPISGMALKTLFFNMCKPPLTIHMILNHLVNVGSIVRKSITITHKGAELNDEIFATPNTMLKWENEKQKIS